MGYKIDNGIQVVAANAAKSLSAVSASASTALWAPATGKRYRLMGVKVNLTNNAQSSASGVLVMKLLDGTTDIGLKFTAFTPTAAATAFGPGWSSGYIALGNGIKGTLNTTLNIDLSTPLTVGSCNVTAVGREE